MRDFNGFTGVPRNLRGTIILALDDRAHELWRRAKCIVREINVLQLIDRGDITVYERPSDEFHPVTHRRTIESLRHELFVIAEHANQLVDTYRLFSAEPSVTAQNIYAASWRAYEALRADPHVNINLNDQSQHHAKVVEIYPEPQLEVES